MSSMTFIRGCSATCGTCGASLLWHTAEEEIGTGWDQDEIDEPPPSDGWGSYHVFFLAPDSEEFHYEDETTGIEERDDPLSAKAETTSARAGLVVQSESAWLPRTRSSPYVATRIPKTEQCRRRMWSPSYTLTARTSASTPTIITARS
jgi:hypothetical protein